MRKFRSTRRRLRSNAKASGRWAARSVFLPANAEVCNQFAVTLNIVVFDIVEQPTTLTNQHQESAAAVVIFLVILQVLGEVRDACGKQRNLNLGRTSVGFSEAKGFADTCHRFVFWRKYRIHKFSLGVGPGPIRRASNSKHEASGSQLELQSGRLRCADLLSLTPRNENRSPVFVQDLDPVGFQILYKSLVGEESTGFGDVLVELVLELVDAVEAAFAAQEVQELHLGLLPVKVSGLAF